MKKLIALLLSISFTHVLTAQEKGIINNAKSPYVKLRSIDMGECVWTEGFWADKFRIAEQSMVPYMGELLCGDVGHGLNNFKIAAGQLERQKGSIQVSHPPLCLSRPYVRPSRLPSSG